ncbi:Crp/Fnr family transcriptional regulator [Chryseolinea sp. T2]|uniref:Crp/Fnr family transcriptional regulator n=1 Tax=Chryseolinea sp. T2 TaxID=3129255 RepID=UPI003076E119
MSRTRNRSTDWTKLRHLFKRRDIPARTILLEEGKMAKNLFIIEKGCLRTWVSNNGRDITTQFFFEGDGVSSIESFMTKTPSPLTIESIEPCVIQSVSQKEFLSLVERSPEMQQELHGHIFRRLIQCQQSLLSHLKDNPQKRYEDLLKQHPEIIQRVPQHYIASYLGITAVSLSRIRSRR